MFAKLKMFFIFVVLLCAGCQTNLVIEEGIPKMHKPLPKETKVFLVGPALENADVQFERSPAKITRAFKKGLSDFGIDVLTPKKRLETKEAAFDEAKKNKCDVILYVTIESWGYADAGFSGIGARDEIVLKVIDQRHAFIKHIPIDTTVKQNRFGAEHFRHLGKNGRSPHGTQRVCHQAYNGVGGNA